VEAVVKGKAANGVGIQLMKRERETGYSWPSVTTNETMCTLRLLAADRAENPPIRMDWSFSLKDEI
jgi:hypothetical protein